MPIVLIPEYLKTRNDRIIIGVVIIFLALVIGIILNKLKITYEFYGILFILIVILCIIYMNTKPKKKKS